MHFRLLKSIGHASEVRGSWSYGPPIAAPVSQQHWSYPKMWRQYYTDIWKLWVISTQWSQTKVIHTKISFSSNISKSVSLSELNPSSSVPTDGIFLRESWRRASTFVNIDGMKLLKEGGISAEPTILGCEVGVALHGQLGCCRSARWVVERMDQLSHHPIIDKKP